MNALFVMTTESWVASAIGFCGVLVSIISLFKSHDSSKTADTAKGNANKAIEASAKAQKDSAEALEVSAKAQRDLVKVQQELVNTQREVNEMKLNIYKREEEDRRKANLYGEIKKTGPSSNRLIITNKGRASATNVKITFPENQEETGVYIDSVEQIKSLEPEQSASFRVMLVEGSSREINAIFIWDDYFQAGNEVTKSIQIEH